MKPIKSLKKSIYNLIDITERIVAYLETDIPAYAEYIRGREKDVRKEISQLLMDGNICIVSAVEDNEVLANDVITFIATDRKDIIEANNEINAKLKGGE